METSETAAKVLKRPRNKRVLVCSINGDEQALVRVRDNKNWSAGKVIELDGPDGEGMWDLSRRWGQWERRKKS